MIDLDPSLTLADLFAAHRDRNWYFVEPGGNWGDGLIYAGAESLARSLGLRWTRLDRTSIAAATFEPGSCIYLHGGGGLNPWSSGNAFKNLKRALSVRGAIVVQGPQSCETASDKTSALLLAAFNEMEASEVHFFARESNSAAFLEQVLPPGVRLYLDNDTAFHLKQHEMLALAGLKELPRGRYDLLILREDDEAPASRNCSLAGTVRMDPAYYATSFSHWIRIHAYATRIASNRLHSAIAGTLLGKTTVLLSGSYHKNRSVWEHSLRAKGVAWQDYDEGGAAMRRGSSWVPQRLANSWKIRNARLWLSGVPLN